MPMSRWVDKTVYFLIQKVIGIVLKISNTLRMRYLNIFGYCYAHKYILFFYFFIFS
jgi:hypothetical protein